MIDAMANQIKGVIQRYINKARPVILRQHGGQEVDNFRLPLFPSSVVAAASNNFRIYNNRPIEKRIRD